VVLDKPASNGGQCKKSAGFHVVADSCRGFAQMIVILTALRQLLLTFIAGDRS
jgi:hypothetical protein